MQNASQHTSRHCTDIWRKTRSNWLTLPTRCRLEETRCRKDWHWSFQTHKNYEKHSKRFSRAARERKTRTATTSGKACREPKHRRASMMRALLKLLSNRRNYLGWQSFGYPARTSIGACSIAQISHSVFPCLPILLPESVIGSLSPQEPLKSKSSRKHSQATR